MPPKNTVPRPFLFRRGYCIKGGKCDFSHASNDNSQEGSSACKKPKHLIPCLFLKRSGFCSKGTTCDFFHGTNRIRRPQYNHGTNRIRFPQHKQYNNMPTISPLQEFKPTLDHKVQLLQEIEGSSNIGTDRPFFLGCRKGAAAARVSQGAATARVPH